MVEQVEQASPEEVDAEVAEEEVSVPKAEPLTPEQRATLQKRIKDHWRQNAVTSGLDGPPVDTQLKGPARKK